MRCSTCRFCKPAPRRARGLSEAVATFALLLTVFGFARAWLSWTPAGVAVVIAAGYWFTASTSFANPAVTLARAPDSPSLVRLLIRRGV